jgi:hypothetical protein
MLVVFSAFTIAVAVFNQDEKKYYVAGKGKKHDLVWLGSADQWRFASCDSAYLPVQYLLRHCVYP